MDTIDNSNRTIRQGRYQPRPGSIRDPRKLQRCSVDGLSLQIDQRAQNKRDEIALERPRPDAVRKWPSAQVQDIATPQPLEAIPSDVPVSPYFSLPNAQSTTTTLSDQPADSLNVSTSLPLLPRAARPVYRSAVLSRNAVQKPYLSKVQRWKPVNIHDRSLKMLAVVTMVLGLGFALHTFWPIEPGANRQVLSEVTDQPRILLDHSDATINASEAPVSVSDLASHSASPDEPRIIRIPSIDVEARVVPVKTNEASQIKMPENIYDLGWYDGSRVPGEVGAVLVNGHVSGPTERGTLHYLRALKEGETIELERGDGQVFAYKVVKKRTIPYGQVQGADIFNPATVGVRGLNIVAYDARFNVTANRFQHRLIVYAEQL
jgi:hypothetical protein